MEKLEIIERLKSVFEALDYISDICDHEKPSIKEIREQANGELAELEELIIKLEKL